MSAGRLLNVNMAALAFLGTLLLGMGLDRPALPLGMLVAAIASVWVTDIKGRFRLNRTATNVAVVAAVAFSAGKGALAKTSLDVLTMADILVYVQIVLLFQKKDSRTRWDLATLSLTQVFVAATLGDGILFGAILVVYVLVGLSALGLFFLDRERARYEPAGDGQVLAGPLAGLPGRAGVDWVRLGKIALATLVVGPASLFLRYREPDRDHRGGRRRPAPARGGGRWPLAGLEASLRGSPVDSADGDGVGREFWRRLVRLSLVTLALTPVIFIALPRFGRFDVSLPRLRHTRYDDTDENAARPIGFSDTVTLGELGKLGESAEEVLRIEFVDHATGERYPVEGDVYLRGAVLTRYQQGRWRYPASGSAASYQRLEPRRPESDEGLVRQKIKIKPMDRSELFCVWPFVVMQDDDRLWFDPQLQRLRRLGTLQDRPFSFQLGTTALREGTQAALVPNQSTVDRGRLLQRPAEALPRLGALADRWIEESGIPADDHFRSARFLEEQLRSSGQFEYSLEGPGRQPTLDPIEDFITNTRRGNCEYFATALALMLRRRGIPARLVVGYKSDEYDYSGQFYQVRQLHAHSWVEAYLAPERLPSELPDGGLGDWSAGGWLRLDPTPAASGPVTRLVQGVGNWFDWLSSLWGNYVIGMDQSRQRALIYRPLIGSIVEAGRRLASLDGWRSLFQAGGGRGSGRWSAWRGGPAALLAVLVLLPLSVGLWLVVRRRWRLRGRPGRARAGRARATIGFYRRLEVLLLRHGLTRSAAQTQREFAREAGAKIAQSTGQNQLAGLPVQVAECFYHVRFGGVRLDRSQTETVEQALRRLEQASDGRKPPGQSR